MKQLTGTEIREMRKKHRLSQRGFASLIGVSPACVYQWENNVTHPTGQRLKTLQDFWTKFANGLPMATAIAAEEANFDARAALDEMEARRPNGLPEQIASAVTRLQLARAACRDAREALIKLIDTDL